VEDLRFSSESCCQNLPLLIMTTSSQMALDLCMMWVWKESTFYESDSLISASDFYLIEIPVQVSGWVSSKMMNLLGREIKASCQDLPAGRYPWNSLWKIFFFVLLKVPVPVFQWSISSSPMPQLISWQSIDSSEKLLEIPLTYIFQVKRICLGAGNR